MPFLIEDSLFRDEPFINSSVVDDNDYYSLNHIYTRDCPDTYKVIELFRVVLDAYKKSDGKTRYFTVICFKNYSIKIRTKNFIIKYVFNTFEKNGFISVLYNQYYNQNNMYPKLTKKCMKSD